MGFLDVASTKDLPIGKMKSVKAGDKPVLLVNLSGTYYAIGNVCTHMGCMLSTGKLVGENVQCACHGSVFSVKTGKVVSSPAKKPEPSYQVKVEGERVLVNI